MTRTAVVTGGSRGIGKAITQRLAEDGFDVTTCARTPGSAASVAAELRGQGLSVTGVQGDISKREDVRRLIGEAVDRTGRLDVLVNVAGIFNVRPFLDLDDQAWSATLATNLTGAFLCSQEAARAMIASDPAPERGGRIISIASTCGLLAEDDCADYNVSKGGLIMLMKSMALDLAPYGILCNSVAPGYIATEMVAGYLEGLSPQQRTGLNPLARAGNPEDIAHVVAMLCDPRAAFVNGSTILVDGGQTAALARPA